MRRVTRNFLVGVGLVVVALLVLGAIPSYLGAGDPYYLTAEATTESGPAVNVTDFSARRYPYLAQALDDGRSAGYRKGPFGLKDSFAHSPFDEFDALVAQNPDARMGDAVLVEYKGQRYRIEIVHP